MADLTESERALAAYLAAIANDPRVRIAGWSASKLRVAVLDRMSEDFVGVMKFAGREAISKAESPAARFARAGAETMLGGTVSEKARGEAAAVVETLVRDGFQRLGKWVQGGRRK